MLFLCQYSLLSSNYYWSVDSVDSPSPGYLMIDNPNTEDYNIRYALVDNYGYAPYLDTLHLTDETSYFFPFSNEKTGCFEDGQLLIYDNSLTPVDTISAPSQYLMDFHDAYSLPNGHYILICIDIKEMDLSEIVENGQSDAEVMVTILVETDNTGEIYWTWDPLDHMDITDVTDDVDLTMNFIDFNHANSLDVTNDGYIYLSSRNLDEVTKINKGSGEIVWRMGGSDSKANEFTFVNDSINDDFGFSHQHSIDILNNGHLLLFDNGTLRSDFYSRAVEYQIDEVNKIVTKVWEYRHSPDIQSVAMGNTQRLENGNTLINWSYGKITEVTSNGSVELSVSLTQSPIYQAFKTTAMLDYLVKRISNTGSYVFYSDSMKTNIEISVEDIEGSGRLSIEKHDYAPPRYDFIEESYSEIFPYRWVCRKDSIDRFEGKLKIILDDLEEIDDPQKVTIYNRKFETKGQFYELPTYFDNDDNIIYAEFTELGEFIICSNILDEPDLIFPEYFSAGILTDSCQFKWTKVKGALNYKIQLSETDDFSEIVSDNVVNDTIVTINELEMSKHYYWRVFAFNRKDSSQWSESFELFTKLSNPSLISPEINSQEIKLDSVLKWSSVPYTMDYEVQVSHDNYFTDILINRIIPDTSFSLYGLRYNKNYYWRVRAFNQNDTSEWSQSWFFTTEKNAPELISPENNETDLPLYGFLYWRAVPSAKFYAIQISDDSTFTDNVKYYPKTYLTNEFYFNLDNNEKYYWRVIAIFENDTSGWSETWCFTTEKEEDVRIPELLFPTNGSVNNDTSGVFMWTNSVNARSYVIEVALSDDLEERVLYKQGIKDTLYDYSGFIHERTYYWRVKAFTDTDSSNWSDIWHMKVRSPDHLENIKLIYPYCNALQVPVNGYAEWEKIKFAKEYQIQITNSSFDPDSLSINSVISENKYHYYDLKKYTNYFWRVRYFTENDTSKWTDPCLFITEPDEMLSTPMLLYPIHGEMKVYNDVELIWQDLGDVSYKLKLSEYPRFQKDVLYVDSIKDNKYSVEYLEYNTEYFWTIFAFSKDSYSLWANAESFTTELPPVHISYPSDKDQSVPPEGNIYWDLVDYASHYLIQIADSPNFQKPLIHEVVFDKLFFSYALQGNTRYYVRVKAYNNNNESRWTNIEFKTSQATDIAEKANYYDEKIMVYPNPLSDILYIEFSNSEDTSVDLSIINLIGDSKIIRNIGRVGKGKHILRVDLDLLPNGFYYLILDLGYSRLFKEIIINK